MTFKDKKGKKSFQNWSARALLEHPIPQSSTWQPLSHSKNSQDLCKLAVKDTVKAQNQSPSVQSSSSSKLPPSSGLRLGPCRSPSHHPVSVVCKSFLQMICSWGWEKRSLVIFSDDSVLAGTWPPQHVHILKNNESFHYQMLSFPISRLPTGQGRVKNAIYFWLSEKSITIETYVTFLDIHHGRLLLKMCKASCFHGSTKCMMALYWVQLKKVPK